MEARIIHYQLASSFLPGNPDLRVIHEEKRGKGLAVQRGMLEATGDYRFICDVDLSMPIEEVNRFIPPQLTTDIIDCLTRSTWSQTV